MMRGKHVRERGARGDVADDEQFKEEKAVIIKEISLLQPLERPSMSPEESLDAGPFSPMSP
jgi:hypothetical protein